ncbi:MAG TPA: hypothetical protein ENG63_09440 [Candidatus Desulfofervidus auxilii]|uniref:Flavodoxin domain-containing protein n=1 Tax=Desulfofervidus auxilii TaxID=1621989 RepID=A0A7C0U400_DESA2|nr:hypothetical protein [Candidatus Desulfofervidus auxilii]
MKTLIVYATKYGSTKEIVNWMKERIEFEVKDFNVKDAPSPKDYDLVIIGGPVYEERILKGVEEYIEKYKEILEEKKVAIFCVCLDTKGVYVRGNIIGGWNYLMPILRKFKNPPIHAAILHGEINPKKLTEEDKKRLLYFYNKILKKNYTSVPYRTMMQKQEVWEFIERLINKLVYKE